MKVQSYEFGKIKVDGKSYTNDIIIFSGRVKENWWRGKGHLLQVEDLREVFEIKPKKLIIGTGYSGMMEIDSAVREKAKEFGIEILAAKTEEACQLYNQEKNKENTVIALHLTC